MQLANTKHEETSPKWVRSVTQALLRSSMVPLEAEGIATVESINFAKACDAEGICHLVWDETTKNPPQEGGPPVKWHGKIWRQAREPSKTTSPHILVCPLEDLGQYLETNTGEAPLPCPISVLGMRLPWKDMPPTTKVRDLCQALTAGSKTLTVCLDGPEPLAKAYLSRLQRHISTESRKTVAHISVAKTEKSTPWLCHIMWLTPSGLSNEEPLVITSKTGWNKTCQQTLENHCRLNRTEWEKTTIEPESRQTTRKPLTGPPKIQTNRNLIPKAENCLTTQPTTITLRPDLKPKTDDWTNTLLELDEAAVRIFNPVIGRGAGLKTTTLWRPAIERLGLEPIKKTLEMTGYSLETNPAIENAVEKKRRHGEKIMAPNYGLTPYEAMAYYTQGPRRAEKTVTDPQSGKVLWIAGKKYHISPGWKRTKITVDRSVEEETLDYEEHAQNEGITIVGSQRNLRQIQGSQQIQTTTERDIEFGFSTFLTETEGGPVEIKETVSRDTIYLEKERIAKEIEALTTRLNGLEDIGTTSALREKVNLEARIEAHNEELERWTPMLEDFLEAFPPEDPPTCAELHGEEIAAATKTIIGRFGPCFPDGQGGTTLKDYQIKLAALGAVKRSHLNGSCPGAGKTIMAIAASWRMGHHYNWIICPTTAMETWAEELERCGLHHEMVGFKKENGKWVKQGTHSHLREITGRFHRRERKINATGRIEPEYYILSAEQISLGAGGNLTYQPWQGWCKLKTMSVRQEEEMAKKTIPPHWKQETINHQWGVWVWSDREDTSHELERYGWNKILTNCHFHKAVPLCPVCKTPPPDWTKKGFCKTCGHSQASTTAQKQRLPHPRQKPTGESPQTPWLWEGEKRSNRQWPAYKLMGKHAGCKIIDEIHNWTNFSSQHGAALLQIKTKDAIVLSGTLCRTRINEIEPSLCEVYQPNSGTFPYSPWAMGLFRHQFETNETEVQWRTITQAGSTRTLRKTTKRVAPEASNLTRLRALMHGITCSIHEQEVAKEWNLQAITERIEHVTLDTSNAELYRQWEEELREAWQKCTSQSQKTNTLRRARENLGNLRFACDGPEKLEAALRWIREGIAQKTRSVVVGPSRRLYTLLCNRLKEEGIAFQAIGSINPEKRNEALNTFRNGQIPVLVSRIRLINTTYNQMTCCTRILFTGIDPSPAAIRQMQRRLNRIGQTQTVHCTFLISQLPEHKTGHDAQTIIQNTLEAAEPNNTDQSPIYHPSYEERLLALILRREQAIAETVTQADRQRDPAEFQEVLQNRQTLNQVLEEIVTNAKVDPATAHLMKKMALADSQAAREAETQVAKRQNKPATAPTERKPWRRPSPLLIQGELFS
jgi:hypothetical protein